MTNCQVDCPGHFGHIRLPLPVFHPVVFDHMYEILLGTCTSCEDFHADPRALACVTFQLRALNAGVDAAGVERLGAMFNDHVTAKKDKISSIEELETLYEATVGDDDGGKRPAASDIHRNRKIEPLRSRLHRAFVTEHFRKRGKKCKNCGQPMLKLINELKNKILLRKVHATRKEERPTAAKRRKKKPTVNFSNDAADDDEEDDLEMEKEKASVDKDDKLFVGQNKLLTPQRARTILRRLWELHSEMLTLMYPCLSGTAFQQPVDIFLLESLAVPPVRFRPLNVVSGRKMENPQSLNLIEVLKESRLVEEKLAAMKTLDLAPTDDVDDKDNDKDNDKDINGEPTSKRHARDEEVMFSLYTHWTQMQQNVNAVYDSALDKRTATPRPGVKQILEKKTGLFRMNLMGKCG